MFNTIDEALKSLREGKLIIVIDDENREDEGDLICACEFATTESINFMAKHARGLICMPMNEYFVNKLALPLMVEKNTDNYGTAFTISIDYVGTKTGISAEERSVTALKCMEDNVTPDDFRRPGHMFPLLAKKNGVLEREGHTEATVDLMRLCGLKECGLCCEIMKDDGTMMHLKELEEMAKKHNLVLITIKDLKEYRKKHEKLIERFIETNMPTKYGVFKVYGYINKLNGEHHVALVKGDISGDTPVLCRVHSECLTGDAFGSLRCDCGEQFDFAMRKIEKEGRGVLLYMRQEGRGIGLVNKLKAYGLQDKGLDTVEANIALGFKDDLREYYIACQILKDLELKKLKLLTNNPKKIEEIEDFGFEIAERVPIEIKDSGYDSFYLKTKKEKMGHILSL